MSLIQEPISARFTFRPERAAEFIAEGELPNGDVYQPNVTQLEYESVEDVMIDVNSFSDALENAIAVVNGRVICLTGEVYDHKTHEDISDDTEED